MNLSPVVRLLLIPTVIASLLTACGENKPAAPAAGAGAPPPANVATIIIASEEVANVTELPGRIDAIRNAEVRARVGGIVQRRLFNEGSEIRAGATLYQIDPAPFQAVVSNAEAVIARAEANLGQANTRLNRYRALVETNAISKQIGRAHV